MSVLLRQAHGFEGFFAVEEDLDAPDLAVGEFVHVCHRRVARGGEAAGAPGCGDSREGEDPVRANRVQAFNRYPEVGSRVLDIGKNRRIASAPSYTAPINGVRNWTSSVQQAR